MNRSIGFDLMVRITATMATGMLTQKIERQVQALR